MEKLRGGLRVDSRAALLRGGDGGLNQKLTGVQEAYVLEDLLL